MAKLEGNKARDESTLVKLHEAGWETLVVWECELKDLHSLKQRLLSFLGEIPKDQI